MNKFAIVKEEHWFGGEDSLALLSHSTAQLGIRWQGRGSEHGGGEQHLHRALEAREWTWLSSYALTFLALSSGKVDRGCVKAF